MPSRLRPTAPIASDAILVGDPGRALLLAQDLIEQPKMSNHARGLWGYGGRTAAGRELTIQSTGMGGPSATLVLEDLVELGVRRAVRVGTCAGGQPALALGEVFVVGAAIAAGASGEAAGAGAWERVLPDPRLSERLEAELGPASTAAVVASFDAHPVRQPDLAGAAAADMQTAPLLARARSLGVAVAAVLIVAEATGAGTSMEPEALVAAEKDAGRAAAAALSP